MKYPKLIEELVHYITKLPNLGKSSATKIAMKLCSWDHELLEQLIQKLDDLKNIRYCQQCCILCDESLCSICADSSRQHSIICIVENIQQVIAIEKEGTYQGVYHILGKYLDLLNDITEEDINFKSLENRLQSEQIEEVILAMSFDFNGEATAAWLKELIKNYSVKISRIALGVPMGIDIAYADSLSLSMALERREKI